ncbi:Gfo/Idh/MocA family protein [Jeotgalibaca sp. A122]|uniref:Gfo/Idh/MocA family protein n=1 Tax=Jeotgalibaca sp. A122 TaxID=3457322 RepID=UPI003FD57B6D
MKLGVIGYGARTQTMVEDVLRWEPDTQILISDPREEEIKKAGRDFRYHPTPEALIETEKPDGILIGTRCSLHTEMASRVLPYKVPFILEKPVATTMTDLLKLKESYEKSPSPVLVSFPLRFAEITQKVKEIVDSGLLGTIEHVQAVNNVPYGGVYYQSWYRDEKETGGLFLQKATHDLDYINFLLGIKPQVISAMESKQIYNGDKPAGLLWENSDEKWTSPESPFVRSIYGEAPEGEYDPFSKDTGNHDSASVLIQYESGMHVVYSQNFYSRKKAARRGARLIGYKGTLEFDFYTQEIKIAMHHQNRVETYAFDTPEWLAHYGGDDGIARNFIGMMKKEEAPKATMEDGLLSALMCLKAKESAEKRRFELVTF